MKNGHCGWLLVSFLNHVPFLTFIFRVLLTYFIPTVFISSSELIVIPKSL